MDKISIIIPVYNASRYLYECMKTVLNQTYSNIEVILVDDGSSDGSGELCDKFSTEDSRIKVIHQKNSGVSAARNAGLKLASGEYIAFIDADDMIHADMYEVMLKKAKEYNADMVATGVTIRNLNGQEQPEYPLRTSIDEMSCEAALEKLLTKRLNVAVYTKLFKREIINEVKFRNDKRYSEDKFFVFEAILRSRKIIEIPECKYIYVKREDSATTSLISKKNFDAFDLAVETEQYIMEKYPQLAMAAQYNLIYTIIVLMRRLEDERMTHTYDAERAKCLSMLKEKKLTAMRKYGSIKENFEFISLKYNPLLNRLYRKILRQIKSIKAH